MTSPLEAVARCGSAERRPSLIKSQSVALARHGPWGTSSRRHTRRYLCSKAWYACASIPGQHFSSQVQPELVMTELLLGVQVHKKYRSPITRPHSSTTITFLQRIHETLYAVRSQPEAFRTHHYFTANKAKCCCSMARLNSTPCSPSRPRQPSSPWAKLSRH
jgi:hypothetical protein